jgi:hypothetical protein
MSMRLYSLPEVYQSSWIEMKTTIAMRYEVDQENELATLFFGHHNDYVITLNRDNLTQLLDLGTAATQELSGSAPEEHP